MYKVEATLLVNEARVEMPIAPTESTQLFVNRVSEEDLNSEIEVLKSRKLIENVASHLIESNDFGLDSSPSPVKKPPPPELPMVQWCGRRNSTSS